MVVTAHPDDVDFGAGGSVATWVKAGIEVAYCVATDGDAGGSDRSVSRSDMARIRRQEQRAAGAELGVTNIAFLGYPDGRLAPGLELRRDVCRAVRQFRPDRLVCQSPERNWERIGASHPDHLAAGEAAVCVAYPDARNPFAHPELLEDEGLEPHAVKEMWLMASPRANRAVDITDVFDRKVAALRRHESQVAHETGLEGRLRSWASAGASAAGLDDGRLAELFQVVVMPPSGSA
ncbi:MAG: PIG-L deacetylase family protein [Acidimicrobiales bacterium]|jgi:LmbE family N-acetylglucosaminyl deacetylase